MFKILKWPSRIALAIVGILIATAAVLMTTQGQRLALSVASYVSASQNFRLSFGHLEGSLFNRARIDRIIISDREGPWLELRNLDWGWAALSLLRGHINVELLTIETLKMTRQPLSSEQPQRPSIGLPDLPPIRLSLKEMQIDELVLGEELAGAMARFRIAAKADLTDHRKGLAAYFLAERLDRSNDMLEMRLDYTAANRNLDIQVSASELAGGLASKLLQIPLQPALDLKFSGTGPLDAWRATWSISEAKRSLISGGVRLDRYGERHRLSLAFSGHMHPLLPSSVSALAEGKSSGSLVGHFTGLKRFDASHIVLTTDTLKLHAAGGVEAATSYAYGALSLSAERNDTTPLKFALPNNDQFSLRKLQIDLTLPDQRSERAVSLKIAAKDITHTLGTVGVLKLNARAKQQASASGDPLSAERIEVHIKTNGFSSSVNGLTDAIGTTPRLEMVGSSKASTLTIDRFYLGSQPAHIIGSGFISADRQTAKVRLNISDIGRFSTLSGESLAGRLDLETTLYAEAEKGIYDIAFDGAGKELSIGHVVLDKLAAQSIRLSGGVTRSASGEIKLRKFDAMSSNLLLSAKGVYARNAIELDHRLNIGDLSAFHEELKGAGALEVRLSGAPERLSSRIRGRLKHATWRGAAIEDLTVRFDGKGPIKTHKGPIQLVGAVKQRKVAGRAKLTLGWDRLFAAQDVRIDIGRNSLTGNLQFERGAGVFGKFSIEASHLADLDAIAGKNISGALTGQVELLRGPKNSVFKLKAHAPFIEFAGNTLKELNAVADLSTFASGIGGQASLSVDTLSNKGFMARGLSLEVRDSEGLMAFVGGGQINDARLSLNGLLKPSDNDIDVSVKSAKFERGALSVSLVDHAQLSVSEKGLRINTIRLSSGRGGIEAGGYVSTHDLDLKIGLKQVPAGIANAFVPDLELDGKLNGRARIKGTLANTVTNIDITWRQATARPLRDLHIPPVSISLRGDVQNDTANARIDVSGPQSLALSVKGNAKLKTDHRMRLQVSGKVPLTLGNALLASRATQFDGRAEVSGNINGTFGQPIVDVKIQIPDASVNDPQSGIKLKRVIGLLRLTEDRLQIHNLKGESEFGGKLLISGAISHLQQAESQARIAMQFKQFRFDDRELMAGEVDSNAVSYTHLRAHETRSNLVCRLLLEKKLKRKIKGIS